MKSSTGTFILTNISNMISDHTRTNIDKVNSNLFRGAQIPSRLNNHPVKKLLVTEYRPQTLQQFTTLTSLLRNIASMNSKTN